MKKLMIMLAVVAVAGATQAATYSWSNLYALDAYGASEDSALVESGTMYLMNNATVSQSAFIAAVLGAGDAYATAFATQVGSAENYATMGSDSALSSPNKGTATGTGAIRWDTSDTGSQSFYTVVLDTSNKGVYVSELMTQTVKGVGDTEYAFEHEAAYNGTKFDATTTTFQGAGWYTAASIPEPTSGLLMLVGLGALALRRRRA